MRRAWAQCSEPAAPWPAPARSLMGIVSADMTSRTPLLSLPLLATSLALALAACGGAGATPPTTPAPAATSSQPAGDTTAGGTTAGGTATGTATGTGTATATAAPAAPKVTKQGPNVTPEGVVFNYKAEGKNRKIYLAGNFNNWNKEDSNYLLKDDDGDGIWSITVKLPPGTYQYKYVIEGTNWVKDPYSPGDAPDGFGGRNGQFDVK